MRGGNRPYDMPMRRQGLEVADDFIRWGDTEVLTLQDGANAKPSNRQLVKLHREIPETVTVTLWAKVLTTIPGATNFQLDVVWELVSGVGSASTQLPYEFFCSNTVPAETETWRQTNSFLPLAFRIVEVPAKDIQVRVAQVSWASLVTPVQVQLAAYAAPRVTGRHGGGERFRP